VGHQWARVIPTTSFPGKVGQGENGNYGVTGEIAKNAGAVGYISAYYAISQPGIYTASLENAAGRFEQANGATIEEAAKSNSHYPGSGLGIHVRPRSLDPVPVEEVQDGVSDLDLHLRDRQQGRERTEPGSGLPDLAVTTGQKYGAGAEFYSCREHRECRQGAHQQPLSRSARSSLDSGPGRKTGARVS